MKRLALLCLALVGASAQAQTVYRCGPEGRVYSQMPCEQGRALTVSDGRSAEQLAHAQARVRDEQALGEALERERLDRESSTRVAAAASLNARPVHAEPEPKSKASKKTKRKSGAPQSDDFKAIAPSTKKTKRA